jgi:hypothetical protein
MSAEMEKAKAKVEFKMAPNSEEGSYCQNTSGASENEPNENNVFIASFSNVAINFAFDF